VLRELARGEQSGVYLASCPRRGLCVIKLRTEPATDGELDQVRHAALVAHPNLIRVYDVGAVDGAPYLALEYVDGVTLAGLIAQWRAHGRRAPVVEVVRVLIAVLRGMDAAREIGESARADLDPWRVLFGRDGSIKLDLITLGRGDEPPVSELASMRALFEAMCTAPSEGEGDGAAGPLRQDLPPALEAVAARVLDDPPSGGYASLDELRRDLELVAMGVGTSEPVIH
jgi:hypothetical protein